MFNLFKNKIDVLAELETAMTLLNHPFFKT